MLGRATSPEGLESRGWALFVSKEWYKLSHLQRVLGAQAAEWLVQRQCARCWELPSMCPGQVRQGQPGVGSRDPQQDLSVYGLWQPASILVTVVGSGDLHCNLSTLTQAGREAPGLRACHGPHCAPQSCHTPYSDVLEPEDCT